MRSSMASNPAVEQGKDGTHAYAKFTQDELLVQHEK